jgi:hypothetical protein
VAPAEEVGGEAHAAERSTSNGPEAGIAKGQGSQEAVGRGRGTSRASARAGANVLESAAR